MNKNNRRIIKLFESVPKFDTYSQYSNSLEKVFHENSLKFLIKHLKEERKAKIFSYFDVEKQNNEPNKFNIFKRRKEIKKDNSKNNLLYDEGDVKIKNKDKDKDKEKESQNELDKNTNNRFQILTSADSYPFRYNPNYNSIMKKVPYVKIIQPSKKNTKNPSTFLTEIGDLAVSSNNLKKTILNEKNKNSQNKLIKELNNKKKKLSLDLNGDKNNHSIRFDKYSERKEIKTENNPTLSYIEPYDYQKVKNNSTDFNKMTSREDVDILKMKKSDGPSVGCYNPHYEYFEDRVRNISLGNEHINKKNKKMLLKKIWGSYKVKLEYELIDNSKLNNDILKHNNIISEMNS